MMILLYTMITLMVTVSLILILLVLIQKGRGGGLASAFGGVGGHTAFGSKTGDVLTWATSVVFGVFLILSVVTGVVFERVNDQRMRTGAVAVPAAPAGGTNTGANSGGAPVNIPSQVPPPAPDPGAAGTPNPTTR